MILDAVAGPIRRYLRERKDTIRCIVTMLTDDGAEDVGVLFAELGNAEAAGEVRRARVVPGWVRACVCVCAGGWLYGCAENDSCPLIGGQGPCGVAGQGRGWSCVSTDTR